MSLHAQLAALDPATEAQTLVPGTMVEEPVAALPERQYCIFRAGSECYSLSVLEVEEVVDWAGVTRVPLAPSFLLGVFNLRGVIVPVVDIAKREVPVAAQPPKHLVVAALRGEEDRGDLRLGLAADEVMGTYVTTDPLMVEEAPRNAPHCCGVLRYHGRLALALELRRLADAFPIPLI